MPLILIAEDDQLIQMMIDRYLRVLGYQTLLANNGAQVRDLTGTHEPDLILMDMGMPVVSGLEATQQLKADPRTRTIPIIALTAYAFQEDRERAELAGVDAFHAKPIEFERLVDTIRTLIARSARR